MNLLRNATAPGQKPERKYSLKVKRFHGSCSHECLLEVIRPLITAAARS